MQRRGEAGQPTKIEASAAGVQKMDGAFKADEAEHAEPAVEINEVRATAEQNVLAVVEDLAGLRILK